MKGLAIIAMSAAVCPKSQLQAASRTFGSQPWTHEPYCVATGGGNPNRICVFTDVDFRPGHGISIITRPDVATRMVEEGMLDRPSPATMAAIPIKYEALKRKGMGVGLYVKQSESIKAGDVVLVDYPTIVNGLIGDLLPVETKLHLQWKALLNLPQIARDRSRDLARSRNHFADELENVLETNAFTHDLAGSVHDVLFPEAARLNHACLPNVFTRTNDTTFAMEVVALRDIYPGEEILNTYLDPSNELSSIARREAIINQWNFTCTCSICLGEGVARSDERRREITKAKQGIQSAGYSAVGVLSHTKKLIELYEEEGMIMPRAANYWLAAIVANALGLEKQALVFAASARKYWTVMYGQDSEYVKNVQELERDPSGHSSRPKAS